MLSWCYGKVLPSIIPKQCHSKLTYPAKSGAAGMNLRVLSKFAMPTNSCNTVTMYLMKMLSVLCLLSINVSNQLVCKYIQIVNA